MTILPMQKIELIGLLPEEEKILELLKKEGILEIREFKDKRIIPSGENMESQIAGIRSAISFIEKFSKTKKSLIDSLISPKFELKKEELINTSKNFNQEESLEKIQGLDQELNNIAALKNNLLQNMATLAPFKNLDIPLNRLDGNQKISAIVGSVKTKEHKKFEIGLRAITPFLETEVVEFQKNETYIVIYFVNAEREKIEQFLNNSGFNRIKLLSQAAAPLNELNNIKTLLNKAEKSEAEYIKEALALNKNKYNLMLLHDFLLEKQNNFNAKSKSASTRYTFVVRGWITKKDLPLFKEKLQKLTSNVAIFEVEKDKDEKVPVAIENPKVFAPFELILKIFGTPSQKDIEPTMALTPFFILFFGICLSDVGYGILLILFATLLLKKLKLPRGGKSLVILLLLGGIVTIPIGVLTGSYLGLSATELPSWLSILKQAQIIEPIKNPVTILIMSLALGIVQIFFGLILQGIKKIREGDWLGAILDDLLWIFFISSLVSIFVFPSTISNNAAIILVILLILTQGRSEKGIIKKFLMGLLSLYNVSGYLGDTLSYSRLLALMMSTSIIGMVINILANMVKDSVPIIGYVFMFAILIVGHIFNLIISTMSAFIHSMRLQLVEFFPKFFVCGGSEFKPFRHQTKYVNIVEK